MTRFLTIGGIALMIVASIVLYQVKYQVQGMERDLASMRRDVVRDRAEIQVLEAEWSYLNQPERLQDLAGRFLDLGPIKPEQMAAIEGLPPRAIAPAAQGEGGAPVADAGTAKTISGLKPGVGAKSLPGAKTAVKANAAPKPVAPRSTVTAAAAATNAAALAAASKVKPVQVANMARPRPVTSVPVATARPANTYAAPLPGSAVLVSDGADSTSVARPGADE